MTYYAEAIHHLCAHNEVNANLVAAACKVINAAPENERVELFVRFLYECKYTPTDTKDQLYAEFKGDIPKNEQMVSRNKIAQFVRNNYHSELSECEFHCKLYQFIQDESSSDMVKQTALMMACLSHTKLPYVNKSTALTMTQEDFELEEKKIDPLLTGIIKHLSRQDFSQVTEIASKYIDVLDMAESKKEKSILLALMLMRFRAQTMRPSLESLLSDD